MILDETKLFERLDAAKRVVLLEPQYQRRYPPLGLAKISSYLKARGTEVSFTRSYDGEACDLVCMSTLFTYDFGPCLSAFHRVRHISPDVPVLVGGVAGTLLRKRWDARGADVFPGYSTRLDEVLPDYSIDWQLEEPWDEYAFAFTTRGCPNNCHYCAVNRLEPQQWVNPKWREILSQGKKRVVLGDNNLSAAPREHVVELLEFLAETQLEVIIDSGIDCKFVDDEMAALLAKVNFFREGLRLAFDRIEENGVFQAAIRKLMAAGIVASKFTIFVLFCYTDTPAEALFRASECRKLKIRAYPQMFTPLNSTNRRKPYLGKHWTKQLAKSFRYFWIMKGAFTGCDGDITDFANWCKERWPGSAYALGEEDWAALNKEDPKLRTAHDHEFTR